MKLQSVFSCTATLGNHRYEVEVETYKTIVVVYLRRLGWATGDSVIIRGSDRSDIFGYLREHISEIDTCYDVNF